MNGLFSTSLLAIKNLWEMSGIWPLRPLFIGKANWPYTKHLRDAKSS